MVLQLSPLAGDWVSGIVCENFGFASLFSRPLANNYFLTSPMLSSQLNRSISDLPLARAAYHDGPCGKA